MKGRLGALPHAENEALLSVLASRIRDSRNPAAAARVIVLIGGGLIIHDTFNRFV